MIGGALLSECGTFRYRLWRQWGDGKRLLFCMLNPSKADAVVDDPTIRRCCGFARRLGYDGIEVVNLFAYRATDPADLRRAGYLVGPHNNAHVCAAASSVSVSVSVVAWGLSGPPRHPRLAEVFALLAARTAVFALRVNRGGTPAHPLMLPYSCRPAPWQPQ